MSHIGQQQSGPIKFLEYIPIVSTFTGVKRLSDTINAQSHLIDIKQNKEEKSHEYKWLCANNQSRWRAGFALVPILGNIVVMGMDIAAAWKARGIKKDPEHLLKLESTEYQKEFLLKNEAEIDKFLPYVSQKVRDDWNDDIVYNNMDIPDQINNIKFNPSLFSKSHPKVQEAYVVSLSKTDEFGEFFAKLTDASKANVIKEHPGLIKDNYDVVLKELNKLNKKDLDSIFEKDPNIFYDIKANDNATIFNTLDIKTKMALAEKVVKPNEKFSLDMLYAIVLENNKAITKLKQDVVRAILDKNESLIVHLGPKDQAYFAGDKPSRLKLISYDAALLINAEKKHLVKDLNPEIQEQLLSGKKIDTRTHMFNTGEEQKVKHLNNVKPGEFVKSFQEIYNNSSTTSSQKKELDAFVKEYLKTNRTHDKEIFDTDKGTDFFIKLYSASGDTDKNTLFDALKAGKQPNTNFVKILNEGLTGNHPKQLIDDAIKSQTGRAQIFDKKTGLEFLNKYPNNVYDHRRSEVKDIIGNK